MAKRSKTAGTSSPTIIPPFQNPPPSAFRSGETCGVPFEYEDGTTTLGFLFNDRGVILAVDHSRTPPDDFPENVVLMGSHVLVTFSGGSAPSRDYLRHRLPAECLMIRSRINRMLFVCEVVELLSRYLTKHPDSEKGLSLGILVAGLDLGNCPTLYKMNGKGEFKHDSILATGSGSTRATSIVKSRFYFWDKTEAVKKATLALCMAVYRAPKRLDYLSIFHIGEFGVVMEDSNLSIREWQLREFAKRGMTWVDPDTRVYGPFSEHIRTDESLSIFTSSNILL